MRLKNNRDTFVSLMECEHGLLDKLISKEVLNEIVIDDLSLQSLTRRNRNKILLDYWCDMDMKDIKSFVKLRGFIEALQFTHQSHLAALLTG